MLKSIDSSTGSILFGGVDTAKFHGGLKILPIQKPPNGTYTDFTVALSSVSFADATAKTVFSQSSLALPVILDSGASAMYLPEDVLNPILNGIGPINDPDLGLIIPCSLGSSTATISFGFGGANGPSIEVSFGEVVTPIYLDDGSQPRLKDGRTVCGLGLLPSSTGPFVLGDTFLRSAYIVYDLTNNQIGIAQTNFNSTSSDIVEISGSGIPGASAAAPLAVTQTFIGPLLITEGVTKSGGQLSTYTYGSPIFNLGATATSSTIISSTPSIAGAPTAIPTSNHLSNHHGISRSAKLGIGIGVPLGVIFLAFIGYILLRRGRHKRNLRGGTVDNAVAEQKQTVDGEVVQVQQEDDNPVHPWPELHGQSIAQNPRELEGSPGPARKELP